MPQAEIFIRPDVTVNAAVPATVSHPRLHDLTNAVRVQAGTGDIGVVEIRVGQGLNSNVTIGTETTAVGAGHAVTLRAGDAVGGGPSAGGSITIQPGAGIGGGARGRVVPNVDNAVSLGSLTVAFFEIVVNTVGSLNQPLNLVAARTTDGVGQHIIISGGPAIGAGPSAGGNVQIVPGNGVGGGARGFIHLDDAGAALSVLPTTTNLVTVGSATLALAMVRTRAMQPDTGNGLVIRSENGNAVFTINNGTALLLDNTQILWGNASDFRANWSTASANNLFVFSTGVNTAAQSGNIIFTTTANVSNEHGLAAVATPRLAIFSAADMSVAGNRTQYVQLYHSGTEGVLVTGSTDLVLQTGSNIMHQRSSGGANRYTQNGGVAGVVFVTFTQVVNTSGTPTGFLWTAGAHTGLTASTESIDWNVNLARTVQFATGALTTQRAFLIQAPTYGFVGASTLTTTATLSVTSCPAAGANATFTNPICVQFGGAATVGATSAGFSYRTIDVPAHTITVTGTTQVTATVGVAAARLDVVTLTDASVVTVDHAATLHIIGPPVGAGSVTITTAWAIRCDAGAIGSGAGTASRPGHSFAGDPDTGLYSQAANAIGFAAGGTERFRVDTEAAADQTTLLVSVTGGAPQRVSIGAADSGGAGFRLMRVAN